MNTCLVIMPNNPGDILMALHVVDALYSNHSCPSSPSSPSDHSDHSHNSGPWCIDFLVDSECEVLVRNHPQINQVHSYPRRAIQKAFEQHLVQESLQLVHAFTTQLQRQKYHKCINLFQGEYGMYLASLVQAQEYLGQRLNAENRPAILDYWSVYLYAIPACRQQNTYHAVDIYLRIAQVHQSTPCLAKLPHESKPLSPALAHITQHPYICVQLGSAWPGKQWPATHWEQLMDLLLIHSPAFNKGKYQIILTGAKAEYDAAQKIQQKHPNSIFNACGLTNLLQVGAVLRNSALLLCGDTFAMHMAAMVGCPILALFGPSNPVETGPYASGSRIIQAPVHLQSQLAFAEQHSQTMAQIPPALVHYHCLCLLGLHPPKQLLHSLPEHRCTVWESSWSAYSQGLVLSTIAGNISQSNRTNHTTHNAVQYLDALSTAIQSCLTALQNNQQSVAQTLIAKIDSTESEMAVLFANDLRLEMYRIQINSLLQKPLATHLQNRLKVVLHTKNAILE